MAKLDRKAYRRFLRSLRTSWLVEGLAKGRAEMRPALPYSPAAVANVVSTAMIRRELSRRNCIHLCPPKKIACAA